MSDDIKDVPKPTVDALVLVSELMVQSAQWNFDTMDSLYQGERRRRVTTHYLITKALQDVEYGGTTAQYERILTRIVNALYPSEQLMDAIMSKVDSGEIRL